MWSIDAVETQMRDQIRAAAVAYDTLQRTKRPRGLRSLARRLVAPLERLRRDPITSVLLVVLAGSLSVAAGLVASGWPIGGGTTESGLAISQGASLIFVVILTTLLLGPLEAGRSLGSDAAWIARDAPTWIGLGAISGLSLTMLLLGWSKPDSREELATIFMTATGLAITAMLVRRLLRLSDPVVQLNRRRRQSIRRLGLVLRQSQRRSEVALKQAGVEDAVAQRIQSYADPTTQAVFAAECRSYTAIARSACGRSDWHLAVGAYANAIATALEYLRHIKAVADTDQVLHAIVGEADDLHQVAHGATGRPFAEALMQGLHVFGRDLITLFADGQQSTADRGVPGLPIVARSIQTMAARELTDTNAIGPASAMRILGDFATGALRAGAVATTAYTAENLISWAVPCTNASQIHVAIPAWEEALGLLVLMFRVVEPHDVAQVHGVYQRLGFAVEKIDPNAIVAPSSGLDPILKSSTTHDKMTLQLAWYDLWDCEPWALSEVADFGRLMAWQLTELLRRLPTGFSPKHFASADLSEILYQFVCAAATRLDREEDPACRKTITESILNTLGWLRGWTIPETGAPDEEFDLNEMIHCYVSGWQIVLHAERNTSPPREELKEELNTFLARLTQDATRALPGSLEEGLGLLESWLRRVGYGDLADAVKVKLDDYEAPTGFLGTDRGWGHFGSTYHTRRGGLIPGIVSKVEEFYS